MKDQNKFTVSAENAEILKLSSFCEDHHRNLRELTEIDYNKLREKFPDMLPLEDFKKECNEKYSGENK